jgi:hypothetical protein
LPAAILSAVEPCFDAAAQTVAMLDDALDALQEAY